MKKLALAIAFAAACVCLPASAQIQGSAIGKMIEGVFNKSDLTVADLAGGWTVKGSAVSFKSSNLLKKAGGVAASAAVETKLDPYYQKFGLTGAVFTIQSDGSFTMKAKMYTLNGVISEGSEKGIFNMQFKAAGIPIGSMTTYIEKTSQSMDIMFDATKMRTLLTFAAKLSGSKMVSAASKILDSYDGMCIGFGTKKTADVQSGTSTVTANDSTANNSDSGSGLGGLLDAIRKKK